MEFPKWHYVEENDFPENYSECITYSYKCNEYTHPVLVITSSYKCVKAIRARMTDEENFKWQASKGMNKKSLHFDPNKVIMWCFVPNKKYLEEIYTKKK